MSPFDPYDVLGIPRDADAATVRRAYQKLARRHHPDLAPGDPAAHERFERVLRAYRILGDPDRRRLFDDDRAVALRRPDWVHRSLTTGRIGSESFLEIRAEWMEWLEVGPEEAGSGAPSADGVDLEAELTLDFAEAVRGLTKSFSVQRERPCEDCDGLGRWRRAPCPRCGGRGVVVELERLRVRIPPGVADGTRLRVRGKGRFVPTSASGGREIVGNLLITVTVRPHDYFRRDGLDVHAELPVSFAEAALGGEIEVPTVGGPVRVQLPSGTQGGQRFRLRGKGIQRDGEPTGDHYYTVWIVVPKGLGEADRERIAALPKIDPRKDLPRGL